MYRLLISFFLCALPFIGKASSVEASTFGYDPLDATSAFQAAIYSEFDTVVIDLQVADWNVGPSNFFSIQNKTIIFEDGVTLKARTGAFADANDCLVRFVDAENVALIGYQAVFEMNKAEYAALNDSEFRHCLSLFNCKDITILGLTFRDSGGDGIYIGGENTGSGAGYCENIVVEDVKCINNYRQGMSVASVENLRVSHSLFTETQGTLPEAGLDIEPYETYHRVINARFDHCSFTNNGWSGIAIALFDLDGTSPAVDITFEDCYLQDNCRPDNSYALSEIHLSADDVSPVLGNVTFERCLIDGSDYAALYSRKTADAYSAIFRDCVFRDVSRQQINFNDPIFLEVPDYDNPSDYLGGYLFDEVLVSYDTDFSFFRVYGWTTLAGLKDVAGSFTVVEPNGNTPLYTDVPEFINVDFTYNNETSLPIATVSLALESSEANYAGADYQFFDKHPLRGLNYYRLLQTDFDGTISYSSIVSIEMKQNVRLVPNPARDMVQIFSEQGPWQYGVLYDARGQQMPLVFDQNQQSINVAALPPGIYWLLLYADQGEHFATQIVKE